MATSKEKKIESVKKVDGKLIKPILEFILEIWANNDKQIYEYILAWLQEVFIGRNHIALLLYSNKRLCGKNFLLNWLSEYIFGYDWYESNTPIPVPDTRMVVTNSNTQATTKQIDDLINAISNNYVPSAINRANYVITTNSLDAFPIAGTGRFMCLAINEKYANDAKYFRNLWNLIANDIVAAHFYTFIYDYNATEESKTFISTEIEKKMTRQSFEVMKFF